MKITDVTLTLFAWDNIPPTSYGAHSGRFAGTSALGLLRLMTDQGLEGHAFLGSAMNPATSDGQALITHLKPVLLGKNPLDRERLNQEIWTRQQTLGSGLSSTHNPRFEARSLLSEFNPDGQEK